MCQFLIGNVYLNYERYKVHLIGNMCQFLIGNVSLLIMEVQSVNSLCQFLIGNVSHDMGKDWNDEYGYCVNSS